MTGRNVRERMKVTGELVRRFPHIALVPAVVLACMLTLGVVGVHFWAIDGTVVKAKQDAEWSASSVAQKLQVQLQKASLPLKMLERITLKDPTAEVFIPRWDRYVDIFFDEAPPGTYNMFFGAGNRLVRAYPPESVPSEQYAWDFFADGTPNRDMLVSALQQGDVVSLQGPIHDSQALIFIKPIYVSNTIEDETWGYNATWTNCPQGLCWNSTTKTKFLGTLSVSVDVNTLLVGSGELQDLKAQGYKAKLWRRCDAHPGQPWVEVGAVAHAANTATLGQLPDGDNSVCAEVPMLNQVWKLCVQKTPWVSRHLATLYAMVVVVSLFIAGLMFILLVFKVEHKAMLQSVLPKEVIDRMRTQAEWKTSTYVDNNFTSIKIDTPAAHMFNIISSCLNGNMPDIPQLLAVRDALQRSADVYRPTSDAMRARIESAGFVDAEVRSALVHQLLGVRDSGRASTSHDLCQVDEFEAGGEDVKLRASLPTLEEEYQYDEMSLQRCSAPEHSSDINWIKITSSDIDRDSSFDVTRPSSMPIIVVTPMSTNTSNPGFASNTTRTRSFHQLSLIKTLPVDAVGQTSSLSEGALMLASLQSMLVHLSEHTYRSPTNSRPLPAPLATSSIAEPCCVEEQWKVMAAVAMAPTPLPNIMFTQLEKVLASADTWSFDAYALDQASKGHPLSVLGYYVLHRANLIQSLHIDSNRLVRFLQRVEDGYAEFNPYHNRRHAADVLQSLHVLIHCGGLLPGYVDKMTMLAAYLAAIVHDYQHRGRNNDFLVNMHDDLAIMYNDRSPMENWHLAAAFRLLKKPEFNCLSGLNKSAWTKVRKLVIDLVLATDVKQHFAVLGQFEALHSSNDLPSTSILLASVPDVKICSGTSSTLHDEVLIPISENDRLLSLQMALKLSDLGHLAAPSDVHLKWVKDLEEEFFRQGDAERAAGLAISPLCDRFKEGVYNHSEIYTLTDWWCGDIGNVRRFSVTQNKCLERVNGLLTQSLGILGHTVRSLGHKSQASLMHCCMSFTHQGQPVNRSNTTISFNKSKSNSGQYQSQFDSLVYQSCHVTSFRSQNPSTIKQARPAIDNRHNHALRPYCDENFQCKRWCRTWWGPLVNKLRKTYMEEAGVRIKRNQT